MADYKFVNGTRLDGAIDATADAIRAKTGGTDNLTWDMDTGFTTPIGSIVTLSEGTASDTAVAGDIRSGKTAHVKGALVTGTITDLAGGNKYATTSDQTISCSGKYMTSNIVVKKLAATNYSAGNIKSGVTISVSNSSANVYSVAGTFTKANTVSSGQTAATAGVIRSGYSAWVDGAEVKGSLGNTSVSQGTTTVSGETATRGTATWDTGVISSGILAAATFANEATSGTTYVDISGTTSAPVLVAGDYLYINKGYVDNLKISLAKLVPDGSDVKGHAEYVLSGHSAYDNDGILVAGSIPTIASSNLAVSGRTVTVPVGYYTGASGATAVTKSIGVGTVTSGTATITSLTKTYNSTNGNFDITGSANVSAPTVGTAGYISSTEGTRNTKSGGATVSTTIPKIVATTAMSGATSARKPTISKQATPTGVTNAASGDATTTAPTSGVYVAVKSSANTGTITATPSVTTAGYGDATNHGITGNSSTVGAAASDTTYIPITTTTATLSGRTVTYGTGWITGGSKSVDVGKVTSGSATISSASYAYNSTNGNFDVTGSASIGAPTVNTAGYISSTEGTRTGNTANLSTTVAKIVGSTAFSGTTTKQPSITKQDVPSGVTQAASGAATTTAPSSGVYVAVKSAANTGTITATPSVSTAGYGDGTNHGIAGNSTIVGASASAMTYIPITVATPSFDGGTLSGGSTATGTNVTLSTTDNGMKIQTAYTAASTAVLFNGAVNGWVTKADNAQALAAQSKSSTNGNAYYVTAVTMPKDKGFTVTTTADTALDTTSDLDVTNNAYRRVDVTNKANGTVLVANSGSTTVTSGSTSAGNLTVSAYNSSGTAENNKSIVSGGKWVATSVSATGTYYGRVTVGAVTGSIGGSASGGSATAEITNTNSIATITDLSGKTAGTDYWQIKATATGASGSYTPKYTVTTAGWLASTVTGTAQTVSVSSDSTGKSLYIPRAAIAGACSNATATTTVAPGTVSISKQSTPSGVTNAASGNATTTAPSSGVYVAVKATAAANTTGTTSAISGSGTATVGTAGYAPTSLTGSVTVSGTATAKTSAKDSSMTYVPITTASPAFTGGGLSGTATASSSTASISDSTNNSGVSLATACTATRANVTYNGAVAGWVSKSSGTVALSSGSTAMTTKTYYINGVTLTKPSSGTTRTFAVTVPNGSSTATFTFNVDSSGNVTITES